MAGKKENATTGSARGIPGQSPGRMRKVEVKRTATYKLKSGTTLGRYRGRPSTLAAFPFDRLRGGLRGKQTSTFSRLWAQLLRAYSIFRQFGRRLRRRVAKLRSGIATRVLYPDDFTRRTRTYAFCREYFLVACSLPIWCAAFRGTKDWDKLPEKGRDSNSMISILLWRSPN